MIKLIKHHWNRITHLFRDVGTGKKRSSRWPALEKNMIAEHPFCAACHRSGTEVKLQAHHCIPFNHDASKELDESNIIILCESLPFEDHLHIGHAGNWKKFVPQVREYAAALLADPSKRDEIIALAKKNAKIN